MKWNSSMFFAVILPAFSLFVWVSQAAGQQPQAIAADGVELSVLVTDVKHTNGTLLIGVFNQEDGFPREIQKALVSSTIKP